MDKISIDELYGRDSDGNPKIPEEELMKKINEIIDWINNQS